MHKDILEQSYSQGIKYPTCTCRITFPLRENSTVYTGHYFAFQTLCKILIFLITSLLLNGCASKQGLGGIATVSALVVALPLIPFAETYHAINDTQGKAKAQQEQWRLQFDPVYKERIKLIEARNAIVDAENIFNNSDVAFLPVTYQSGLYTGLIWNNEKTNGEINQKLIDNNDFLKYIQSLLSDDPVHEKTANYRYHSRIHDCFESTVFDYQSAFNQKMSALSGKHSTNKIAKSDRFKQACDPSAELPQY